jgi:eukaryotic-like serine/threonine-protein kinase
MTPERWRQVTRVYGALMTQPPAARAAALAELCPGDEALRKEVEALLADESGAAVLDRPLGDVASSLVGENWCGRALGPYRLEKTIGAGGMGQVYCANDTRLHRPVAIKVLMPVLAHDPQFRARFDREAKAIAALNHPHICTLHDIGSVDGVDYLVMEYVDGETLATRLERGPLPFDQALASAIQIAEALAAAHRQGIVHRDLKPGNVMSTKSGIKLLDFGLAKPAAGPTVIGPISMLPTTPPLGPTQAGPLTVHGTILGTLQYMAPEQLEGRDADARTDIFAFGAIVYEMVTGKKAFSGGSQASLIGAIMHAEPKPMAVGQPMTPPALERLVRICLAKDPDQRWQSVADLARELRSVGEPHTIDSAGHPRRGATAATLALTGLTLALVAASATYFGYRLRSVPAMPVVRFTIIPPAETHFGANPGGNVPPVAVSPDGRWITFAAATPNMAQRLWIRGVDSLEARVLPGTEGARYPFWSPDSRSIGFFTQVDLKRTEIAGGTARKIADVQDGSGGGWSHEGLIVFGTVSRGLFTVPDNGGAAKPLHPIGDSGLGRLPLFLPDGRHFVYWDRQGQTSDGDIRIASIDDSDSGLLVRAVHGVGLTSRYLLFVRGQTLFAQSFDPASRMISGAPISVADGVAASNTGGYAAFSSSNAGVLAFAQAEIAMHQARWYSRAGTRLESVGGTTPQTRMTLSPDERQMIVVRPDPSTGFNTLWNWNIAKGTEQKVAAGGDPVFSLDGKMIAFIRMPNALGLGLIRSDGTGQIETLVSRIVWPTDWSHDGRKILTQYPEAETGIDVGILDVDSHQMTPLVHTPADEGQGYFSPDSKAFAYVSSENGRLEVFVQSLATGERTHVSIASGGSEPRWRRNGKELFYLSGDLNLMAVRISSADGHLSAEAPSTLFHLNVLPTSRFFGQDYDVSADGQRILVNELAGAPKDPTLTVIVNWPELLKEGK